MATSGEKPWPPGGNFVATAGEKPMAIDSPLRPITQSGHTESRTVTFPDPIGFPSRLPLQNLVFVKMSEPSGAAPLAP